MRPLLAEGVQIVLEAVFAGASALVAVPGCEELEHQLEGFEPTRQAVELVFGDGSQTRSFQYVDDLVEGIYRLLMSDEVEPVNIGNPDEITIKEFAEEVVALTGSSSTITYEPLPADDPKIRQPDITKAREILGWEPRVDRAEGLRRTLDYFRQAVDERDAPPAFEAAEPGPGARDAQVAAHAAGSLLDGVRPEHGRLPWGRGRPARRAAFARRRHRPRR